MPGVQYFTDGATPIPAGALTVPDAEQLVRILKRGQPVTMHLTLVSEHREGGHSGNVIAEVPGRDPTAPILLVGGHLDSWDLATGAIDDGAGVAIMTAAAKHIMDAGRPQAHDPRRLVWRRGAGRPGRRGLCEGACRGPLRDCGRKRFWRRSCVAFQQQAFDDRSRHLWKLAVGLGAAQHPKE